MVTFAVRGAQWVEFEYITYCSSFCCSVVSTTFGGLGIEGDIVLK